MPTPAARSKPWPIIAVAGWVLPGLGHALLGEGRRGLVVGGMMLILFIAGLLIGGIDVVDRERDTLWFAGQAMIGPAAFIADYAHQRLDEKRDRQVDAYGTQHNLGQHEALTQMVRTDQPLVYRTSVGRVNEIGTLYCAIAGVMNLLAILDAVGRATAGRKA